MRLEGYKTIAPRGVFTMRRFWKHKDDTGQWCEDRDRPCRYCNEIEQAMDDSKVGPLLVDYVSDKVANG